jgi:hypothetical protein
VPTCATLGRLSNATRPAFTSRSLLCSVMPSDRQENAGHDASAQISSAGYSHTTSIIGVPRESPFRPWLIHMDQQVLPLELGSAVCTSRATRNHLCRSIRLILMPREAERQYKARYL